MAISQHTRFENHMDIASPETVGDAQKVSDFFDENPYDDDFEEKLSQVDKNISSNESHIENNDESVDKTTESSHINNDMESTGNEVEDLALSPTMPPLPKFAEGDNDVNKDEPKLSTSSANSASSGNPSHAHFIQQTAEKVIAFASALDAVGDILSGGAAAVERPNKIDIDELPVQSSLISTEGHHDKRSLDDVFGDLGFEIDHHKNNAEETVIDTGQAIESIGSDADNQAELVDELSKNDIADNVTEISLDSSAEGGGSPIPPENPPIPPESNVELKADIAYRSVVDANPEYGEGGGIQYFIPHAHEMKLAGKLSLIEHSEKFDLTVKEIDTVDIRDSANSEYKIHIDKRGLSQKDAEEILATSNDITSDGLSESISDEELQYLDENTIATEGVTDTKDRFFINENGESDSREDYYRPHGNQEDTFKEKEPEKWIMPDSWTNPEELKDGDVFYQLSPVFRDGKSDTFSSYFTDKTTVDSCRDENGNILIDALMRKLQMPSKTEILEDSGERKEVYVGRYELSAYVYKKEPNN